MKQPTYFCDFCNIEKYDSETQTYMPQSFSCKQTAHYHKHIDTQKHILNTLICKNLTDDLIVKCKHCGDVYTKEQYKQHLDRNSLLWTIKTNKNIYKYSVCNHFIYEEKRFNSIKIMKEYIEHSTRYEKEKNKKKKLREQIHKILDNDALKEELLNERRLKNREKLKVEMDLKQAKKKEKEAKEKAKIAEKLLSKIVKNDKPKNVGEKWANEYENTDQNLKLEILPILKNAGDNESYYIGETPNEKAKREREDFDIPPLIDESDICDECGYTRNFNVPYTEEKLKRYNIKICSCYPTEDESE